MSDSSVPFRYWRYEPSFGAAVTFAVLYTATCIITVTQYFYYRCWFWVWMVIAGIMESLGYICRSVSVMDQTSKDPYFIQYLMIFLAPALIAAGCYMVMGRVLFYATPPEYMNKRTLWIPPRWITPIFVCCDVVAFVVQLLGAASTLNTHSDAVQQRGKDIVRVGLSLQILCFGFFLIISFRFHFVAAHFREKGKIGRCIKLLWAINFASTCVFFRTIYRMVEFSIGIKGYPGTHDWPFYVFESAPILPCLVIFNIFHPAKYLTNVGFRQRRH